MNKEYQEIFARLDAEDRFYNSASEYDQCTRKGIEIAKDIVSDVKTEFASKTDWIFCKDRKPKDGERILVTLKNGYVCEAFYGFGTFKRLVPKKGGGIVSFSDDNRPFAWKPLPKPCSEGTESFSDEEKIDDWIFCSDRLPNKSGEYLVAVDYYGIGDNAKKNTPRRKVCIKHFWKGEETDTYRNIWQKLPYEVFEVIKWQNVPDGE